MLGIICERKLLRFVDCHSVHKKMFAHLVIQLEFLRGNARKCLRVHQDSRNP